MCRKGAKFLCSSGSPPDSAPEVLLKTLHPHFLFPHMRTKLGNTWISEEYQNRYDSRPVWADYRSNHKGGVPPQRTRKTCIRKDKVAGNPCPICRDYKLHVDFRNVKLLEQFVPTRVSSSTPLCTGVCMKQHKKLTQAIQKARECGLLSYYIPQVEPRDVDFRTVHGAVRVTPPAPTLLSGEPCTRGTAGSSTGERAALPSPTLSRKSPRRNWPTT